MRTLLLIIDPQRDFCHPEGALFVPGADEDMRRLATFVQTHGDDIDDIRVSLDTHQRLDIAHPGWWVDARGEHPAPFTAISAAEVSTGRWRTADPAHEPRSLAYLQALEAGGRYPHIVWPEHCLAESWGHGLPEELEQTLGAWENDSRRVTHILKGTNPWTEHFSAVQAEVPDPDDPATQPNKALLDAVRGAGRVLIAGEARSHCVANTVRDIAAQLSADELTRLVLLVDAMSDVTDPPGTTLFSDLGEGLVRDLRDMGAKICRTTDPLESL